MREQILLNQGAFTVEVYTKLRNSLRKIERKKGYKKPPFNPHKSNNKHTECNGQRTNICFRCGSEDHFIANFLRPDTSDKLFHWNTEKPKARAYRSKKIDNKVENIAYESESHKI